MPDIPNAPPAKPEVPKKAQAPSLTSQEFSESLDKLFARAREAGVRPLQVMATSYAKQGLALLDGFFAALEEGTEKKKAAVKKVIAKKTATKPVAKKAAPKKKPTP